MKVRLALREEGAFWNAYLAHADTMDDAQLIGSIAMGAVRSNTEIKEGFQLLMQMVLADAIESVTGAPPSSFETQSAPESERAGHS